MPGARASTPFCGCPPAATACSTASGLYDVPRRALLAGLRRLLCGAQGRLHRQGGRRKRDDRSGRRSLPVERLNSVSQGRFELLKCPRFVVHRIETVNHGTQLATILVLQRSQFVSVRFSRLHRLCQLAKASNDILLLHLQSAVRAVGSAPSPSTARNIDDAFRLASQRRELLPRLLFQPTRPERRWLRRGRRHLCPRRDASSRG